jgi:RimJ/RimL family protein N-acetyltransferase
MDRQPELVTERLLLRPFTLADAPTVKKLAGDKAVAAMTLNIPHPYEDGMAEEWIGTHRQSFQEGKEAVFAITLKEITLKENDALIGAIGLTITQEHERAEMGYWIGKPYWGNGYCTEAARESLKFAFEQVKLARIQATHFIHNPASGRVMEKIGMTREGCLRQYVKKWGDSIDIKMYAILRTEYETQQAG